MLKCLLFSLIIKRLRCFRPPMYQNHFIRLYSQTSDIVGSRNDKLHEDVEQYDFINNSTAGAFSHSNTVEKGHVYFVATPIGNVRDITLRALEILRHVDYVCAEDTRHTISLFRHISMPNKQMISHHEHNLDTSIPRIISLALKGFSIAVVSDAGTPGISDPGTQLAYALGQAKIPIHPIPGPSAVVAALSISGFPASPFTFVGFIPVKGSARKKMLDFIVSTSHTIVFYESPHRIQKTFQDLLTHHTVTSSSDSNLSGLSSEQSKSSYRLNFGNSKEQMKQRNVVCCREITKLHEQFSRGTLEEVAQNLGKDDVSIENADNNSIRIKGEFTVILGPTSNGEISTSRMVNSESTNMVEKENANSNNIIENPTSVVMSTEEFVFNTLIKLKQDGLRRSEAVKLCTEMTQISKSTVYAIALNIADW